MSDFDLKDWAKGEGDRLRKDARTYGRLALSHRTKANILELFLAIFTVMNGTSGATGLITNKWEDMDVRMILVSIVSIIAALVSCYVQVFNPRQKENNFLEANGRNTALARVCDLITITENPTVNNLMVATVTNLEASFEDDNPLIKDAVLEPKSEIKEKVL